MDLHEELTSVLTSALDAFARGDFSAEGKHPGRHVPSNIQELGLSDVISYWHLVWDCIDLALENPVESYQPPEDDIGAFGKTKNLKLYAFQVQHDDHQIPLYFKFCLKPLPNQEHFYLHINCHPTRYEKRKR